MNAQRFEILPGVMLSYLNTDKFKTSLLSVSLLTQLERETAALNALIPSVLMRGSVSCPDMEKISARSDELYGLVVGSTAKTVGEIQMLGIGAAFPEESFLPKGSDEFAQVAQFVSDILLRPLTRGGLFLPEYVESEKEKLRQLLERSKNNKRSYSLKRCVEEMCCYEDYGAGSKGKPEDLDGINYKKLSRQYKKLLQECPVEVFYCGRESAGRVCKLLRNAFSGMPRGEINYDIGTDIRMNAVEDRPRFVKEEENVSQARLAIGFRLGECMDWESKAPVLVFNAVFGGSCTSKLFLNVREKLGLCYDASSMINLRKGLLFAMSGIDAANFEAARDEIFAQLEAIRLGDVTSEELDAAKAAVVSDIRSDEDSQSALSSFWTVRAVEGTDFTPEDLAKDIKNVTLEDVQQVAAGVECDMIYLLTPKAGDTENEEDTDED